MPRLTLDEARRNLRRVQAGKPPLAAAKPTVETLAYRYGGGALEQARALYAEALEREQVTEAPPTPPTRRLSAREIAAEVEHDQTKQDLCGAVLVFIVACLTGGEL